ncbi:MAG: 50S ribosomal protein L2 [Candidatus Moranbacteria bacterium]|nr:50S ribosomal protein L2 [Candidatus Moranbacteria bacterium]
MPVKIYKKTSPGRRQMSVNKLDKNFDDPEKSLTKFSKRRKGRAKGTISVRHKGGGHKRLYRQIDFKMDKIGVPAIVDRIEKDPNRSACIALLKYNDGEKRYNVAVEGMKEGVKVTTAEKANVRVGNRLMIKNIPVGTQVCLVEMFPGKGAQLARSAGSSVTPMSVEGNMAQIKLASGEIRKVSGNCYATVGQVSNYLHNTVIIGKAGRSRWLGVRPTVRGTVMNPIDHPHGGGEGRQGIGLKHPKTPWGKPALGKKTRKKHKYSNKFIVKGRKKK